ncbi:MAG: ASCH domain-containing protein [Microbacteriaceae bacterium]|nr:ASCH domain-containing protein [Microbacteriaceae bacterium]
MWAAFLAANPAEAHWTSELVAEFYGGSAEMAEELVALVEVGQKRATAGVVSDFEREGQPLPRVGGYWIACGGDGRPRVVQRSVELRLGRLDSVDEAFAWDEGEGERTRADWLGGHRRYFARAFAARGAEFDEAAEEIVFERFVVVWPPEFAD